MFERLHARASRFDAVLDRLQREHARSPQMLGVVHRELVRYQGGAAHGLTHLRSAVRAYAGMLQEHMLLEENLFAAADDVLTTEDWVAIEAAFDGQDDPLGAAAAPEEFRRLRARIVNLLPRKMRLARRERSD